MPLWYRLDNAGKLYPAISDSRRTTVFRISADLTAPINAGRLQETLTNLMPRFPYFAVHLKRGVFWYSLDSSRHPVKVERDSVYPCMRYPLRRRGIFPFRVRCWRNRIAVEFSHLLSDGTGALVFLKSLLAEYLHTGGVPRNDCGGLPVPGEGIRKGEDEYAFRRFGNPDLPSPPRLDPAFRLPLSLERPGFYKVTTGIMPADILKKRARDYEVSITDFLIAVMLDSYQSLLLDMPSGLRKKVIAPVRLNIPVNLRRFWSTPTLRNFFVSVEPEIDPRLGSWSFEEIVDRTKYYMQYETDHRHLAGRMARIVRGELNPVARLMPLSIKNLIIPTLYASFAEKHYTSGISNLGKVEMPAHLAPYIKRFDFIPPPARGEKVKASLVGWQDKVHLSFGRLVRPAISELYMFRRLIDLGIPVKVESN